MRQTTLLTIFLAVVTSVALLYLKYEVAHLEDELKLLNKSIEIDRQAIHVLNAEWSHLNDVERLKSLAHKYLEIRPTDPFQMREVRGLSKIEVVDDPDLEGISSK
ncbi:MAG: hypothetical protein VX617_04945 [Pseudomonadota bacterium]|nr:hypothetical protein [Pseudomonadota bacterium]